MLRRKLENGMHIFGGVSVQAMMQDRFPPLKPKSNPNNFIKLYSLNMTECLAGKVLDRKLYLHFNTALLEELY